MEFVYFQFMNFMLLLCIGFIVVCFLMIFGCVSYCCIVEYFMLVKLVEVVVVVKLMFKMLELFIGVFYDFEC